MDVLETICSKEFSAYLYGFGAIDTYLGSNPLFFKETKGFVHVLTTADTANLAKLFENLRYPGADFADAALDENNVTWYFRCVDSINDYKPSYSFLNFYWNYKTNVFSDPGGINHPGGIYPLLRGIRKYLVSEKKTAEEQFNPLQILNDELNSDNFNLQQKSTDTTIYIKDLALFLAKYLNADFNDIKYIKKIATFLKKSEDLSIFRFTSLSQEEQRTFLCELISSPNPCLGLELLRITGFISQFWPELAELEQADHSKEFHPEGNAWEHTLETFRYRKTSVSKNQMLINVFDLRLSLGLLLHDCGKPISSSAGNHRYEGHAELGESQARRFLERLGFGFSITNDICFLVRNHMLPAALPRLPLFRTTLIMSSPLFPLLMELYRCDESSSFKGLDGYYQSSAVYQQFLRNQRNPYRSADGKKPTGKKQKKGTRRLR